MLARIKCYSLGMKHTGAIDVAAVVVFLSCSYLTAVEFLFTAPRDFDLTQLLAPAALVISLAWITWRVYEREGFFVEPTAKQTIFLGGLLGLVAIAQYFDVAQAFSHLLK